jgi:hypothetical protein
MNGYCKSCNKSINSGYFDQVNYIYKSFWYLVENEYWKFNSTEIKDWT